MEMIYTCMRLILYKNNKSKFLFYINTCEIMNDTMLTLSTRDYQYIMAMQYLTGNLNRIHCRCHIVGHSTCTYICIYIKPFRVTSGRGPEG